MMNVASVLDISARRCPEATAFIHRGRRYSFRAIERAANRIANGLVAEGFGPGSRVALCSHNLSVLPAVYFGVLKTGATLVMLNAHTTQRDLRECLADSGAEALFCQTRRGEVDVAGMAAEAVDANPLCRQLWLLPETLTALEAEELAGPADGSPSLSALSANRAERFETAAVSPEETAVIAYTSGTTGQRKGVLTSHANLMSMTLLTAQLGEPQDCRVRVAGNTLDCLMGQLYTLIQPVYLGQCVVLVEGDDPERSLAELIRWGGTYLVDVPCVFSELLDAAADVDTEAVRRSLRICVTGGAGMAPDLPARFEAVFGAALLPGYGATETTTAVTWTCPGDRPVAGSVGRPIPGVTLEVRDPTGRPCRAGEAGELWVRSPGVMKGYLNRPDATRRVLVDGWYRSGDLGRLGETGELFLHRRLDNKINQGIEQVDPTRVESILAEHPGVAAAKVLAQSDPVLCQRATAYVVLADGRSDDPDALMDWLKDELPFGQSPDGLETVERLPEESFRPQPLGSESQSAGARP